MKNSKLFSIFFVAAASMTALVPALASGNSLVVEEEEKKDEIQKLLFEDEEFIRSLTSAGFIRFTSTGGNGGGSSSSVSAASLAPEVIPASVYAVPEEQNGLIQAVSAPVSESNAVVTSVPVAINLSNSVQSSTESVSTGTSFVCPSVTRASSITPVARALPTVISSTGETSTAPTSLSGRSAETRTVIIIANSATETISSNESVERVKFTLDGDAKSAKLVISAGTALTVTGSGVNATSQTDAAAFYLGHAGTANIELGGTLNLLNSDGISSTYSVMNVTVDQTGILNLKSLKITSNQWNNKTSTVTIDGGRLNLGTGGFRRQYAGSSYGTAVIDLILKNGATLGILDSAGTWTGTGEIKLESGNVNINTEKFSATTGTSSTGSGVIVLNGILSGAGKLVKQGAGNLELSVGNNTYSGGTEIVKGRLDIKETGTGLGTGIIYIKSGGELRIRDNFTLTANGGFSLDGGILYFGNSSGSPSHLVTGNMNVTANSSIYFSAGSGNSKISSTTGTLSLSDSVTLKLTGTNGSGNSTSGYDTNTSKSGILDFSQISLGNGATLQLNQSKLLASTVTVATGTATISGVIANDGTTAKKLLKQGAGTLQLSSANTYSGNTEITGGILKAQNASALGTGTVEVKAGGRLEIGDSITLNNTAYTIVLDNAYKTNSAIFGSGKIGDSATISLTAGTAFDANQAASYKIYEGSNASSFLGDGKVTFSDGKPSWWNVHVSGNTLYVTIPEPSLFGLLAGMGALALVGSRRRRK